MANEQQQTQPQVAIPLPKGKKNAVQIGCICMMLSVAMYGLVFATLTSPILESVNAMGYVSLFSIFAGMGVSIMTPIGGKLGDLIGRRNIVVIPGIICRINARRFPVGPAHPARLPAGPAGLRRSGSRFCQTVPCTHSPPQRSRCNICCASIFLAR